MLNAILIRRRKAHITIQRRLGASSGYDEERLRISSGSDGVSRKKLVVCFRGYISRDAEMGLISLGQPSWLACAFYRGNHYTMATKPPMQLHEIHQRSLCST